MKSNEVINALLERRSTRSFLKECPKTEDLKTIIEAGRYAPSGMNKQEWQFTVVLNQEKLIKIRDCIADTLKRDKDYCCYYNAPVLIILSSTKENPLSCYDCACALENIFIAAHSLGIGSCWINQIKELSTTEEGNQILKDLGIPENHYVYGSAALGYIDKATLVKPRKENTVRWIP